MVRQAIRSVTEENKIESSETLPSLRISPRESLKIVRQMIKKPIQMFRDDYFELARVMRSLDGSSTQSLEVADFCENFTWTKRGKIGSWLVAFKDAKNI